LGPRFLRVRGTGVLRIRNPNEKATKTRGKNLWGQEREKDLGSWRKKRYLDTISGRLEKGWWGAEEKWDKSSGSEEESNN